LYVSFENPVTSADAVIESCTTLASAGNNIPKDRRNIAGYEVAGMRGGSQYLVLIYGIARNAGGSGKTLYGARVTSCSGVHLAGVSNKWVNWPDGNPPQSAGVLITAPGSGCIRGYTDAPGKGHNGRASNITVIEL